MVMKTANIKTWVRANLKPDHPLRIAVLSEEEELTNEEFLILAKRWL